jgi:hypothetical protein
VLSNFVEQDKIAKDIEKTEKLLAEALSRLSRLRAQQNFLRERNTEAFRRGMARLEEEEEVEVEEGSDSPQPMPEEQSLVASAQSLGAFDVLDWNSFLGAPSFLDAPGVQRCVSHAVANRLGDPTARPFPD